MSLNRKIIPFPDRLAIKKAKYIKIRDEIEKILFSYAVNENDLWAVSLAAGRFSAMNLEKIEGKEQALKFFENCIDTQKSNFKS